MAARAAARAAISLLPGSAASPRWCGAAARQLRRHDVAVADKGVGYAAADALTLADLSIQEILVDAIRDFGDGFLECRLEVEEETGLLYKNVHYLSPFHPSIGYTDEVIHLFCSWDITETDRRVDDDEFLLTERLSFQRAIQMVYDGNITDGKTMVSLLMTWQWWQQEGPFGI